MKAVRLFIRDQLSFILFQAVFVAFLMMLVWLDGFEQYETMIYAAILSVVLSGAFLATKFILRRSFYLTITQQPTKLEDALLRHIQGPEHLRIAAYNRQLYRLFQKEVQTLHAANARQQEFTNHWVHQMKTPVSVMHLLLQEEQLDRKSLEEEVNRIQTGLDAVLVNARLETFERDMTIERIDLKQIVQQVINEHKKLLIKNAIFPVIEIEENLEVASDRKWLQIVLGQFITNAVKYTFERNKKICFSATKVEGRICFTVRDEGVGIPSSDLSRVTQAFFTGENGRLTGESTGMGLFIAAEVCERLEHPLTIESEVGVGTAIHIRFPQRSERKEEAYVNHRQIKGSHEDL